MTTAVVPRAVLSLSLPAVLQMNSAESNSGQKSGVTVKFREITIITLCVCVCNLCACLFFIFQNRLTKIDRTACGNRGIGSAADENEHEDMLQSGPRKHG